MSKLDMPRISRMKFGIIDANFVNAATDIAKEFDDLKPRILDSLEKKPLRIHQPFLAKILGKKVLKTVEIEFFDEVTREIEVAWEYEWERVFLKSGETVIAPEDGHEGDPLLNNEIVRETYGENSGYGYNIAEIGHVATSPIIFGIDMSGGAYPLGFRPYGIDDGYYVDMRTYTTEDGSLIYVFDRLGTHDGDCAEPTVTP